MDDREREDMARAMETRPELLPHIPELVADLWELGSDPQQIVELLRPLGLPPSETSVLDLGCGKGAVSITIARELGFHVRGVDLSRPFLDEAARRAREHRVEHLTDFTRADMRATLAESRGFDVALYVSIGGLLGGFDEIVGALRRAVRPGGYLVVDDGFLATDRPIERDGYEHYQSHEATLRALTTHGDELIREHVYPVESIVEMNRDYLVHIRERAADIAQRHPEARDLLDEYIAGQEQESAILATEITGAVWLIRRGGGGGYSTGGT